MSAGEYAAKTVLDSITGKIVSSPNALTVPVGGRQIGLTVGYKLGPAAMRAAAVAVFAHPATRTALGISQWLGLGKLVWDEVDKVWKTTGDDTGVIQSDGYEYLGYQNKKYSNREAACQSYIGNPDVAAAVNPIPGAKLGLVNVGGGEMSCRIIYPNGNYSSTGYSVYHVPGGCPAGWYFTSDGCSQTPPIRTVTASEEFADKLAPHVMPDSVPLELPDPTYLPVESPSPWVNPSKTEYPVSLPLFVPVGDPVPNSEYDPTKPQSEKNLPYITPGVKIIHSPTTDAPFRLDLQPVNRPQESKTPVPGPISDAPPSGGGNGNNNDKPRSDAADLCEKHPDIVACQKLTEPEVVKLPDKEFDFDLTPESGFSGAGACPSPIVVAVGGHTLSFSWQPFCDSLVMIKPLLIAMAWLAAAFIVLGARQE